MTDQKMFQTTEEAEQELSAILSDHLALTEENQALKEKVAELESWIRENRTDLMADMILLDEKKAEITSMQKTTEAKVASIEAYEVRVAVREKKVSEREKAAAQIEERLKKREERISDREYRYGTMEDELASLDSQHTDLREEAARIASERSKLHKKQQTLEYERKKLEHEKTMLGDTQGYIYTVEGQLRDRYRHMTKIYKIIIGLLATYAGTLSILVYLT